MSQVSIRRQFLRKQGLKSLFRLSSPEQCVRLNAGNTLLHELMKAKICYVLAKEGKRFITEAEFTGGRCDVVDLTDGVAFEIVATESNESIEAKRLKYPLPICVVRASSEELLVDLRC